ncbi:hypothetical protein UFOVP1590_46 [uncultured Caudovirales phage]|uniref:Uncharacterized protein n=1 Tax=uncultured Caudovirales phage TaxID=2100421 RepID=A0A6J5SQM7_9CAUD|nr:hypothetical protein UFOVP1590_46 [uncultured Caudovirales phage]
MADISKCPGTNCNSKESCYRFTAPSSVEWQSWFVAPPLKQEADVCEFFIEIPPEKPNGI